MDFKKAMEDYRAGTASEEERLLVEAELEKSLLIAEYLDEGFSETLPDLPEPAVEIRQVKRSLRRRNIVLVLTSLVLAAALLAGCLFVGVPALEKRYWDPTVTSYGTSHATDFELMLAAFAELFCPSVTVLSVDATKTGFACYDLSIQYWNTYRGGDNLFAAASLDKGELTIPSGVLRQCPVNIFDRATYPFFSGNEARNEDVRKALTQLPEYITIVAAVSFPEDKTIEQVLEFQDSLLNGSVGWTAIRTAPLDQQMLPLCGMTLWPSGTARTEVNRYFPALDIKAEETTAQILQTHFKSLLLFSHEQAAAGRGIDMRYTIDESFYTQALAYVEEFGIMSYGCYVSVSPDALLALIDSGIVSQVWIEDVFISI